MVVPQDRFPAASCKKSVLRCTVLTQHSGIERAFCPTGTSFECGFPTSFIPQIESKGRGRRCHHAQNINRDESTHGFRKPRLANLESISTQRNRRASETIHPLPLDVFCMLPDGSTTGWYLRAIARSHPRLSSPLLLNFAP